MTAEVAVANKVAVALAADSIVTIASSRGEKTYNAANKLFTLSKFRPVGILIYGNTTLNGIPLEIIIKEFRQQLGKREYKSLSDYSYAFYRYLHEKVPIDDEDEKQNFADVCDAYCTKLNNTTIEAACEEQNVSHTVRADRNIVLGLIKHLTADFALVARHMGKSRSMGRLAKVGLSRRYPKVVENAVQRIFGKYKLSRATVKSIEDAVYAATLSNWLSERKTGFVIAGFGKSDYYPVLDAFETDGFIAGRCKLIAMPEQAVERGNGALIYPFAQRDASELFLEGVDTLYQEYIDDTVRSLLSGLADVTASHYGVKNQNRIGKARVALEKLAEDFASELRQKRFQVFVRRALEAVEILDKSELATVAESLVSLSALRQKVSLDMETVGGPIDVAVISKGDGFIWVKRKHYFSSEFNQSFGERYLLLETAGRK